MESESSAPSWICELRLFQMASPLTGVQLDAGAAAPNVEFSTAADLGYGDLGSHKRQEPYSRCI